MSLVGDFWRTLTTPTNETYTVVEPESMEEVTKMNELLNEEFGAGTHSVSVSTANIQSLILLCNNDTIGHVQLVRQSGPNPTIVNKCRGLSESAKQEILQRAAQRTVPTATLQALYIHNSYRRRGLGKALAVCGIAFAVHYFRVKQIRGHASSESLLQWYQRFGAQALREDTQTVIRETNSRALQLDVSDIAAQDSSVSDTLQRMGVAHRVTFQQPKATADESSSTVLSSVM